MSQKKPGINFIVGIGRSGTSLLSVVLNQHEHIRTAPENYFLLFFLHAYGSKQEFTEDELNRFLRFNYFFGKTQSYSGWNYDQEKLRTELMTRRSKLGYDEVSRLIYNSFNTSEKRSNEIHAYIDKNPSYTLHCKRLLKTFPDSKFLIMVRDYRANLLSRKKNEFIRAGSTVMNCIRWDLFNRKLIRFMKKNPGKCRVVYYEKLVNNPENEVKKICHFFDLDYQASMLLFHEKENSKPVSERNTKLSIASDVIFAKKIQTRVLPIHTKKTDTWKKELSQKDICIADVICGKTGEYFGYQTISDTPYLFFKRLKLYMRHPLQVLSAYYDIFKDYAIYYAPLKWKQRRFEKSVLKFEKNRG